MVKLNKIYTRTGDGGETGLVDGSRVAKHAATPWAFGEVDEANSVIGLARLHCNDSPEVDAMLARIQNDLFDLGADLATPDDGAKGKSAALRITGEQVLRLEREIDALNAELAPLASFVLPGGAPGAAWLHLARAVVRRAERRMTELATGATITENALCYINRLSDHLFVLARTMNQGGKDDVLWRPGQNTRPD